MEEFDGEGGCRIEEEADERKDLWNLEVKTFEPEDEDV